MHTIERIVVHLGDHPFVTALLTAAVYFVFVFPLELISHLLKNMK